MPETDPAARARQLGRMTLPQLKRLYADVFGEPTTCRHRRYLVKRIVWREQANAQGGLSDRARTRAAELAHDSELRLTPPRRHLGASTASADVVRATRTMHRTDELLPGTVLRRQYKGRTLLVTVLPKGFEHEGEVYRSLSAVAKAATGSHWNGRLFFGVSAPSEEATP